MDIETHHKVEHEKDSVFTNWDDEESVILYTTEENLSIAFSCGAPSHLRPSRRQNRRDAHTNAKHSAFGRRRNALMLSNVLAAFFVISMAFGSYFTAWNVAFNMTKSRNLSTVRQPGELLGFAFDKSIMASTLSQQDELPSVAFDKSVIVPAVNP